MKLSFFYPASEVLNNKQYYGGNYSIHVSAGICILCQVRIVGAGDLVVCFSLCFHPGTIRIFLSGGGKRHVKHVKVTSTVLKLSSTPTYMRFSFYIVQ
jgi:hypothetical protein